MALQAQLKELLDRAVSDGILAGGSVLVLRNGAELAYANAGKATEELPFRRDTICRIYSMTKPVTAAAAMILVQRGQLDPGQWVSDILPEFADVKVWENGKLVRPKRAVLVKDLLNMTSGIPYPGEDDAGREAAKVFASACNGTMTTRQLAQGLANGGLSFHPGQQWMYGASADVLGAVIEAVSGIPFGQFLRKEIFEPLGMVDTGFYVEKDKRSRLADIYESTPDGVKKFYTDNLAIQCDMAHAPAFESGGAGLCSTIDDYVKFANMLLSGGGEILKPETVAYMTRGKLLPWQQDSLWHSWESMFGYDYSNLMRVLQEPGMAHHMGWKGEYGWDGWLGTYFCNSPENGVTVLLFCQKKDAGTMPITRMIRNVITANLD